MEQKASTHERPVVGLMLGDPTGIGPEVSVKLLASPAAREAARVVVVGDARVFELGMADAGIRLEWRRVDSTRSIDWAVPGVPIIDLGNLDPGKLTRARVDPECGRIAGETLQHMIRMAGTELDAICFAPLSKAALKQGGWDYRDEHQMFAELTGCRGFFCEMNVIPEFCTFRVTSHMSLRSALDLITPERIEGAVRLAHEMLVRMGKAPPKIGVAALNPHGGEGGMFGDEEITIIRPTLERLNAAGIACDGPVPSDTIFVNALAGRYDGVVMMYHDQGQIATKLIGFAKAITVTAGLPVVFATPAHGTAFDIVGQGRADAGGLGHALRAAARFAARNARAG
ncbi:MAG: 4-hydroxythreonine-4-phosphate dehydrogenase PdxA [Betaproteobacteria bacterium]|nr:4-hydroxythreonine-4-phosphate dehydrogenase PdxA [Betaproteobacteria bacterium]